MRWWRRFGRGTSRRTGISLAACAVVTAVFAVGLGRLDFATGQDSYLDPASRAAADNAHYQSLFGGENMVVLFTTPPDRTVVDLFSPANLAAFSAVEADLTASGQIESVISPLALLTWTQDMITSGTAAQILTRTAARESDPAAVARRQEDMTVTALRLAAAGVPDFANPDWLHFLIFGNDGYQLDESGQLVAPADEQLVVRRPLRTFIRDDHHAVLAAVLVGNADLEQLAAGSAAVEQAVASRTFEHARVTITGTPTFLTEINDSLRSGMLTLGGIAVLVMAVILAVTFAVRWRLLPLLSVVVGVLWGFGAFGFTGTNLSLVTIAALPILIGLGIEFAVQLQNRLEEERAQGATADPFGEAMARTAPPMVAATVAAVIAFLAVRISEVPMIQDFGALLALGIIALLAAGLTLPTTIIGARERRRPTTRPPRVGWVERTVRRLGSLPRGALGPLIGAALVLPVVGLFAEGETPIESDPINWADQSSPTIANARLLEDETGLATTLGVFVETEAPGGGGVFTDQMGAFVVDLVARAQTDNPLIVGASSLPTTVGWLTDVPGAPSIPPSGVDLLQAFDVAPPALQEALVSDDANAAHVLFQLGPSGLDERAVVLERVEAAITDPGDGALLPANATATTGGLAVVGVGLLENITANRATITIVALLLVGAFVVLGQRDLARGLLTMIPVLLAVGASAVLVRLLGITLSPLTTVSGPLVVATCAGFCLLLVARYAEERDRGRDPSGSTDLAAERTGRAFLTSALTTLGGFAVLMFSPMPLLSDFGLVVTINVGVAVLAALVLIPPLLKEADRHGWLAVGVTDVHAPIPRRDRVGWVVALAAAGVALLLATTAGGGDSSAAPPRRTGTAEAPAVLPTTSTTAATTVPPTTAPSSLVPTTTPEPAGTTLPGGLPERPTGLIAGLFWDALTRVGVDAGVARCAADDLIATTPEADLLAMGIAGTPRPPEVDALLAAAGERCGVTPEQLAAAAQA